MSKKKYFIKKPKPVVQEIFKKGIQNSYKCNTISENSLMGTEHIENISDDDMMHMLVNEHTRCYLIYNKVLDAWILTAILKDTNKHSLILRCYISERIANDIINIFNLK